jgi:hypothetical protein
MSTSADLSPSLETTPIEWKWTCTLRDLAVVESLPPEVRASVERYIRARGLPADPKDDSYIQGWKDGVEAMQDEISTAYVPPPTRRRGTK